ncbi:O-antigen ligase family protein [Bradyrhizobium sp. UFLA05-153]
MFASLDRTTPIGAATRIQRCAGIAATFGLSAVIALAPLPFGSMDTRVIAIWVLTLAAVLLLASSSRMSSRDTAVTAGFAAIALAWIFVVSEQLGLMSLLSTWTTVPIWKQASAILGEELKGSTSVARNQPFFSAGSQIACALSMLCGYLVGRNRRAAYVVLFAFLGSALVYALYGMLAFSFWPNYWLWQQKYNYLNSVTATFINPNVAASYFGAASLGWILVLADSRRRSSSGVPLRWHEAIRYHLHSTSRRKLLYVLACFVMFITTMMTGSRAGVVLSLVAVAGALQIHFRRELRTRRRLWLLPIATPLLVVGAISIVAPRVNERFGVQGFFDLGRWYTYQSTIEIIRDYPWLGTGLGTFRLIFPTYRTGNVPSYGIWEQAHNTTLEVASEMGIPFALAVATGWLVIFGLLGKGMVSRNRDAILPTAAFWIGLLAVVHSQVDFPLQVPGFSLAICPILGMGIAQSFSSKAGPLTEVDQRTKRRCTFG